MNTMFIDHIIFIMKNVLENKTEQPAEHLGVTSIEPLMLAIVRWVLGTQFRVTRSSPTNFEDDQHSNSHQTLMQVMRVDRSHSILLVKNGILNLESCHVGFFLGGYLNLGSHDSYCASYNK